MNRIAIPGSFAEVAEMQNLSGLSLEICRYGIKPREKLTSRASVADLFIERIGVTDVALLACLSH